MTLQFSEFPESSGSTVFYKLLTTLFILYLIWVPRIVPQMAESLLKFLGQFSVIFGETKRGETKAREHSDHPIGNKMRRLIFASHQE